MFLLYGTKKLVYKPADKRQNMINKIAILSVKFYDVLVYLQTLLILAKILSIN